MKIGIYGGSFDPPHIGHALVCLYVLETSDVKKVLLVPCYKHPFGKKLSAFRHRYEMCRLLKKSLGPRVDVSNIEETLRKTSYTIDTVRELKKIHPDNEFALIIGSDILGETQHWKDFNLLKKEVELVIVPRATKDEGPITQDQKIFSLPNISSSMILEKIKKGKAIDAYVSKRVKDYIESHNLYS